MCLNVARNDTTKSSYEVVYLTRRCATNGISDTNTVDANLVDSAVDGQQIDQVRSERVLGRETNLLALALDELNDFESSVLDVCHVLAVAVLAEVRRGSDDDIETIDTSLDSDSGIVHVASYVSKDLGFQLARCQIASSPPKQGEKKLRTPSLQRASQSLLDCSEAAGLVTSMSRFVVSF